MKKTLTILLICFGLLLVLDCDNNGGNKAKVENVPQVVNYSYTTPNGIAVSSVVPIPPEHQAKIFGLLEQGVMRQIERSQFNNPTWEKGKSLSEYPVLFVEPQTRNQINAAGSPAIFVTGIQTAGTVWGIDGDGYNKPPTLVIPHQNPTWEWEHYLMETAQNESEHLREWYCDKKIYEFFATKSDKHPHWRFEGE